MSYRCCAKGGYLRAQYTAAERDLAAVARAAAMTAQRRGQASTAQLEDIRKYRADKATAADAIADHVELCDRAVTR